MPIRRRSESRELSRSVDRFWESQGLSVGEPTPNLAPQRLRAAAAGLLGRTR